MKGTSDKPKFDDLLSVTHVISNQYITMQIIQMLNYNNLLAKLEIADSYL